MYNAMKYKMSETGEENRPIPIHSMKKEIYGNLKLRKSAKLYTIFTLLVMACKGRFTQPDAKFV